jgi:hypothetical protein
VRSDDRIDGAPKIERFRTAVDRALDGIALLDRRAVTCT